MKLNWDEHGCAFDEATGISAQVERGGSDDSKPWVWFLADWPLGPGADEPDDIHGLEATEEAALAAEDAMPDREEIEELRRQVEGEWEAHQAIAPERN